MRKGSQGFERVAKLRAWLNHPKIAAIITERVHVEFGAEFFNAANHANFSTPNRKENAHPPDTADPRITQFGLKLSN